MGSFGLDLARELQLRMLHAVSEMEEADNMDPNDKTMLFGLLALTAKEMGGGLHTNYSGRCMFGAECIGIQCPDPEAFAFAFAQACFDSGVNPREVRELLGEVAQDSLGKSTILYWPRLLTSGRN